MTKRQYDSLLSYAPSLLISRRETIHVSQLQPVGRKSTSFVLPLGCVAHNNKMQSQICAKKGKIER